MQLVEPGQATTALVRRVARRTELDPKRWELAQRLATARLLVAARDSAGVETVELVHEALIPGWDRLREWVDADHDAPGRSGCATTFRRGKTAAATRAHYCAVFRSLRQNVG